MVSVSGLHSNVLKAISVRQADLSTVKFANSLPELLTQADTMTSNKTFEHWRQRDPTYRKFARAMKTKRKKTTATNLTNKLDGRPVHRRSTRSRRTVRCTQITLIFYWYRLNCDESRWSPTFREMTGISCDVTRWLHALLPDGICGWHLPALWKGWKTSFGRLKASIIRYTGRIAPAKFARRIALFAFLTSSSIIFPSHGT